MSYISDEYSFSRFSIALLIMPETEKRTLEEIEMHFSDNSKSLTDIQIKKKSRSTHAANNLEFGNNLNEIKL